MPRGVYKRIKKVKWTEERKALMRRIMTGRKFTEEWKRKIGIANSKSLLGRKHSEEARKNMSLAAIKNGTGKWNKGKRWTDKQRKNYFIAIKNRDYHHSEESRAKMSLAHKGRPNPYIQNEKHWAWKGEEVGYRAIHHWIVRHYGKPTECEKCGKNGLKGKQIHWANKTHTYERDITKWVRLCSKCHGLFDKQNKLRIRNAFSKN